MALLVKVTAKMPPHLPGLQQPGNAGGQHLVFPELALARISVFGGLNGSTLLWVVVTQERRVLIASGYWLQSIVEQPPNKLDRINHRPKHL
jgi:hypothetical protein